MPDPIGIGVIGAGGIFRSLHVPYLRETPLAQVVAVMDVNEEAAAEAGRQFDAAVCGSCEELLAREDVDAVDICTHPRPHRDITVAAARAGKHVLLEKPMCCTVAEADEMIAAASEASVQLQVAYMMRFHPSMMKVKELLDSGTLGDVHLVHSSQIAWFAPRHPWLFVQEESGGMLVEQAIHTLDLWLWLYGDVERVYARTSTVDLGGTYPAVSEAVENNATLIAGFASGATGMLIKSWAAEVGYRADGVVGSKGSAEYSQAEARWKTHEMDEPEVFTPAVPDDGTYRSVPDDQRANRYWSMASKGRGIEHWLRCIRGEETPETSGEIGRAGIAIAEAAYRSAAAGQPVSVEGD
ncbi:MAG: Gfo/Idh/MocA family protein [Armatimonadota bacterium]